MKSTTKAIDNCKSCFHWEKRGRSSVNICALPDKESPFKVTNGTHLDLVVSWKSEPPTIQTGELYKCDKFKKK